MLAKLLVIALFLGILASLASGLLFLVRDQGKTDRTVKALTVRIALSVALFALLLVLFWSGLIEPHGLRP